MSDAVKDSINSLKDAFIHNSALLLENFQLKNELNELRERTARLEVEISSASKSRKYTQDAATNADAVGKEALTLARNINTRLKTIWAIIAFLFGSGVMMAVFG